MRYSRFLLIIALALMSAVVVVAQQPSPPSELDAAIAVLSRQVGTPLTVDLLDSFTWSGQTFADTSLNCPQPDQAYAQIQTSGYQFLLVYQGQTYDYRVTTGGASVLLCVTASATAEATSGATAEVTPAVTETTAPVEPTAAVPTATLEPTAIVAPCTSGLSPRLTIGQMARTTTGVSSNVRAAPDASGTVMGAVGAGVTFTVLEGPACGPEGFNWWRVQQGPLTGWVAEGQNGLYYLEPVPTPLPAADALSVIDATTAPDLVQLSRLQGNLSGVLAWSPDGSTLAVAGSNTVTPGVWLYAVAALDAQPPRQLATAAIPTALAFSADGALLAVGTADGRVTFYDVASGAAGYGFPAESGPVRDLRFSPNGRTLAVIGQGATMAFWGVSVPSAAATEATPDVTVEASARVTAEISLTPGAIPVTTAEPTPTAEG